MKIMQLIQLFALTFTTFFLSASDTDQKDMRTHVEESELFMGEGRIVVYKDTYAVELSMIRMEKDGYSYLPEDIICELDILGKGGRIEDRKWHHCRKCDEVFRTEYQLDRHMAYDHYHSGSRRR